MHSGKKTPYISIIVPIYNTAQYLPACLDSLLAQTASENVEILLIDDASPDGAAEIVNTYLQKHPTRFRSFVQTSNQGVATARNRGLAEATGQYILFVDSDDVVPANALECLIQASKTHQSDIIQGRYELFSDDKFRLPSKLKTSGTLKKDDVLSELFIHKHIKGHPWAKLFKASVCEGIFFDKESYYTQDMLFCGHVFAKATSLTFVEDIVYHYRGNDSGATANKYKSNKYLIWLNNVEKMRALISTARTKSSYIHFQTKAMSLLAKECERLPQDKQQECLQNAANVTAHWVSTPLALLLSNTWSPNVWVRTIKMWLKLRKMGYFNFRRQHLSKA